MGTCSNCKTTSCYDGIRKFTFPLGKVNQQTPIVYNPPTPVPRNYGALCFSKVYSVFCITIALNKIFLTCLTLGVQFLL